MIRVDFKNKVGYLMDCFECECSFVINEAHLLEEGHDPVDLFAVWLECFERSRCVRGSGVVDSKFDCGGADIIR